MTNRWMPIILTTIVTKIVLSLIHNFTGDNEDKQESGRDKDGEEHAESLSGKNDEPKHKKTVKINLKLNFRG